MKLNETGSGYKVKIFFILTGKMYELEPTDYTEDQWFFLKVSII